MATDELSLYVEKTETSSKLALKINDFSGPLDLLLYLISKHKIDIYDIPIKELTEQYFAYLESARALNLDIATDFVLMAATLMQIKSRLLLPLPTDKTEDISDPRQDLVFQLLQYKRCKQIAQGLQERYAAYCYSIERPSLTKHDLGLSVSTANYLKEEQCSLDKLLNVITTMAERNGQMYQNLSEKLRYILAKEKISLKERIKRIYHKLQSVKQLKFFSLLKGCSKEEKITYFLALLELVRRQLVRAEQADFQTDITVYKQSDAENDALEKSAIFEDYQ